MTSAWHHW